MNQKWSKEGISIQACRHLSLHFKYHHSIDDRKNFYQFVPLIEETWATKHWACWVYVFLLSVTGVLGYLIIRFFAAWQGEDDLCCLYSQTSMWSYSQSTLWMKKRSLGGESVWGSLILCINWLQHPILLTFWFDMSSRTSLQNEITFCSFVFNFVSPKKLDTLFLQPYCVVM